jgi:hypothetical protein
LSKSEWGGYTSPLRRLEMKDAYEVLRQTELNILRVRKEIEALLVVAPLLKDESDKTEDETPEFAIRA